MSDVTKSNPAAVNGGTDCLITVAICTRNRAGFVELAVRSVLPQLTADTELLVVDNGSTDDTRTVCERLAAESNAVGYRLESRPGLSVARNTAIKIARGKFVLFLDDDALAEPGWLAAYRNFLLQPPVARLAVVGGGVIPYYAEPPPPWVAPDNGLCDLGKLPLRRIGGGLSGCNSAYDRQQVMAAGFFDEQLGYQGHVLIPREESELQDRLIQAGGECWWLPGAAVRHFVAPERLTIRAMANGTFHAGRAAAIQRLKIAASGRARFNLRLGRLFIAPFHMSVNLLQSLWLAFIGRPQAAVGAWCRATRAVGWAWQMLQSSGK